MANEPAPLVDAQAEMTYDARLRRLMMRPLLSQRDVSELAELATLGEIEEWELRDVLPMHCPVEAVTIAYNFLFPRSGPFELMLADPYAPWRTRTAREQDEALVAWLALRPWTTRG
ncbi:MAG: hypothetical protein ABW167_07845 [Baekduia sp.]